MIETKVCPDCGAPLAADAPHGLCPRCLLRHQSSGVGETPLRTGASPTGPYQGPFTAPEPTELARLFPQLEVLELLGQGGMGAVYKARQPKLDRLVALKILPPQVGRDPSFAERFSREARALAKLSHPHIVGVHDFGEVEGLYYFIMEYVDGGNLRQLLWTGQLAPAEALRIVPQICDALQYAHEEGVVHRDIKPENILLDRKRRVKIADFGLARLLGRTPADFTLTGSQQVMGTPYYMAPEQMYKPLTVDHRADIYSLGVVLYEMLTSELPLGRFAPPSHKVRVDERLDPVVLRALAKEPEQRYQQVSELKSDVEGIARNSPAGAAPLAVLPADVSPKAVAAAEARAMAPDASTRGIRSVALVQMDVKGPAAGLLVTGLLALLSWVLLLALVPVNVGEPEWRPFGIMRSGGFAPVWNWHQNTEPLGRVYPILIPVVVLPAILIILGAGRMGRCSAYEFAVMASILAIIPWYPAWIIGVFVGLWSLNVLRRPDVKAAFAYTANPHHELPDVLTDPVVAAAPAPRRGPFGKIKSVFQSACAFFVTGVKAQPPAPTAPRKPGANEPPG